MLGCDRKEAEGIKFKVVYYTFTVTCIALMLSYSSALAARELDIAASHVKVSSSTHFKLEGLIRNKQRPIGLTIARNAYEISGT